MSTLLLRSQIFSDITLVSNVFIDHHMASANGEYVKIYLYLLRYSGLSPSSDEEFMSVSKIADFFDHTERDIIKALKYWEKEKIISLVYNGKSIESITLLDIMNPLSTSSSNVSHKLVAPLKVIEKGNESSINIPIPKKSNPSINVDKPIYSPNQIEKLTKNDDVQQLLYIAQRYLGRTLNATDINTLLYFYEALSMSTDLIMYLLEYCVTKNQKSMRYIEKVALSWATDGINNVEDAKANTVMFSSHYFSVMKAFGINDRNPVDNEKKYIKKWLEEYLFEIDIILEAVNRTMSQIHKPSFEYAESMLNKWYNQKVRHLSDLISLDEAHNKTKEKKLSNYTTTKPVSSKTPLFPQREYQSNDYSDMERHLLNKDVM